MDRLKLLCMVAAVAALAVAAQPAWAQEGAHAATATAPAAGDQGGSGLSRGLIGIAVCFGAALVVFSGARNIGIIGSHALDSIARQPEASSSMFLAWLFPAAMIEGAMLFGLVICLMVMALGK